MLGRLIARLKSVFGKHFPKVMFGLVLLVLLIIVNGIIFFAHAINKSEHYVVVIDAGHGGNDPGKVGKCSTIEKDINLEIALPLKAMLEEQGIEVHMTRETDTGLSSLGAVNKKTSDLKRRVEIANEVSPDLFISIHQNSYPDSSVHGAQVFYNGVSEESGEIAKVIQKFIAKKADISNKRQAKSGNYYILKNTVCKGVIVECGFLSCPEEAAKLFDRKYQKKLAEAITLAIVELSKEK